MAPSGPILTSPTAFFMPNQPVTVEGIGAARFEGYGPGKDDCSVLTGPVGDSERHLVKLSRVQPKSQVSSQESSIAKPRKSMTKPKIAAPAM